MFIEIEDKQWLNVLQISDVSVTVEKLEGVKARVTMNNGKVFIIVREVESFIKELENFKVSVRSGKK